MHPLPTGAFADPHSTLEAEAREWGERRAADAATTMTPLRGAGASTAGSATPKPKAQSTFTDPD
ncbi:hypothetical protein [Rhodococcus sp. IEGM 1307]|uniref:hypothetical protein n=1 Tax=Rhodococcus sp. IEGM 1307 TaxID=3047091 RepID=UPI001056EB1F|nr:hypothetical protein [Rhodococcus sp. IEGM 1307]MDI9979324.1 hypothetical protein [Rhodococcus sp. IEGM 1307]